MDSKKVGELLAKLRKEKGLTQRELSSILEVSPKTISKWETGCGLPDISFLKKISETLGITIEELLDGNLKNKEEIKIEKENKKRIFLVGIVLLMIILILIVVITIINREKNKNNINDCTVIRTYYIDSVGRSNDDNYLYITIHEFQVEGTYTLKLPKLVSDNLEVGSSYEFTFETSSEYTDVRTDILFNNSNIINVVYTDKEGLDRTSKFYCNKKG